MDRTSGKGIDEESDKEARQEKDDEENHHQERSQKMNDDSRLKELVTNTAGEVYQGRSFESAVQVITQKAEDDDQLRRALSHVALGWALSERQREKERRQDAERREGLEQLSRQEGKAIPCPFVYSGGKSCTGETIKVEAYKADLEWKQDESGNWEFSAGPPRSHYHLFCSEKRNHAVPNREDALKYYYGDLPEQLQDVVGGEQ